MNMLNKSDIELVHLMKTSNHDAFKIIYDRYHEDLFHYAWSRTNDPDIAKEIVQKAFIQLWKSRQRLNPHKTIKPYIFRSVHNLIIDRHRKQKIRQYFTNRQKEKYSIDNASEFDTSLHIKLAIQNLPEKLQSVFVLHHINGYTYKEIAEIERVSKATIENRMKKAIFLLQKYLKDF